MICFSALGECQIVHIDKTNQMPVLSDDDLLAEMLRKVPDYLWAKSEFDVGLMHSAQPVHITLRPQCHPPFVRQYPISNQHADAAISTTINGLLEAGVLRKTSRPMSCTPILPVKKSHGNTYRLVNDLRSLNSVVEDSPQFAEVPNPHVILCNIPPDCTFYSVIDIKNAFYSLRVAKDSQHLLSFMYKGQSYVYQRLAQGYKNAPCIFNHALKQDLACLEGKVQSVVLAYSDDIIIASHSREQCHEDSITVLQTLAQNGHRVSKSKLQYCQDKVEYLSRVISHGTKSISPCHPKEHSRTPTKAGQPRIFRATETRSAPQVIQPNPHIIMT